MNETIATALRTILAEGGNAGVTQGEAIRLLTRLIETIKEQP